MKKYFFEEKSLFSIDFLLFIHFQTTRMLTFKLYWPNYNTKMTTINETTGRKVTFKLRNIGPLQEVKIKF